MTRPLLILALWAALPAGAQTVPAGGLRAEGAGAWEEALRIYRDILGREPARADLWLRIADIDGRLGRAEEAVEALRHAADAAPQNPSTWLRLSQAESAANRPEKALEALDHVLALDPGRPDHLRAHAQLATWAGRYSAAASDYRTLVRQDPADAEARLGLARVCSWAGDLDESAEAYGDYLKQTAGEDPKVLLDFARVEQWRGDPVAGLALLDRHDRVAGPTPESQEERSRMLSWAGRPRSALAAVAPLLQTSREYGPRLARTLALALDREPGEAVVELEALDPARPETHDLERLIRTPLRTTLTPLIRYYRDSDRLSQLHGSFEAGFSPGPATRLGAGVETDRLKARVGSGLDRLDGGGNSEHAAGWFDVKHRFSAAFEAWGRVGAARADREEHLVTYKFGLELRPSETLRLSLERERGFLVLSPRTLDLGIRQTPNRARVSWSPALRVAVEAEGAWTAYSDGNRRTEVTVLPRRQILRRQRLNLDLGVRGWWLGYDRHLGHGYYDPELYQSYAVSAWTYWKVGGSAGMSLIASLGMQKDESSRFRPGGDATAEATIGIYSDWMLKVDAAFLRNGRLASGAYQGTSAAIWIVRRF